jgi:hypothetical protein
MAALPSIAEESARSRHRSFVNTGVERNRESLPRLKTDRVRVRCQI